MMRDVHVQSILLISYNLDSDRQLYILLRIDNIVELSVLEVARKRVNFQVYYYDHL